MDATTAIITIGDTVITKGEVNEVIHMYYGDNSAVKTFYRSVYTHNVSRVLLEFIVEKRLSKTAVKFVLNPRFLAHSSEWCIHSYPN